jgi:hypothetical protein
MAVADGGRVRLRVGKAPRGRIGRERGIALRPRTASGRCRAGPLPVRRAGRR